MENEATEICRLCGEKTESEHLKLNVFDDIGGVKLHQCIEYYCRLVLDDDITLPQQVCDICVSILQNFLFFCNHIERFQNNLFGASRISNKLEKSLSPAGENSANLVMESEFVMSKNELVDQMTPGDIETEDESLLVPIDRPETIDSPKRNKQLTSIQRWFRLYSEELNDPISLKLNVATSEVSSDGEVNSKALPGVKTWHDFVYGCTHCELKFETLNMLLRHFRADVKARGINSYQIKCPECWVVFNRPQYLNHAITHHPNLRFTCIICSKIFQNSVALLKHYNNQHDEDSETDVCFCIQCGLYFTNLLTLKKHKSKEHTEKEHPKRRVLRKPANKLRTPLRITRGRPKGSTNSMLMSRRENLKRLVEYRLRKDKDHDENCETSLKNQSSNESFPEKFDNSWVEHNEPKRNSKKSLQNCQKPEELPPNHQKEEGNSENLNRKSSDDTGNNRLSCDKRGEKRKSQDKYSENVEKSSTESEKSSDKREKNDIINENSIRYELNSYENEKRFLTPSKFFIRPCPKSKKPESSRSLSPNYEKEEILNCKKSSSFEVRSTKSGEIVQPYRPCPLSKKPKNTQESHESSSIQNSMSHFEGSFNYESFSNTLSNSTTTEVDLEPKREKISDLINKKVISNYVKHNDNYLVQLVGDSSWFWLEDVEEAEKRKLLNGKCSKESNVGAKIRKRRLTAF